jgi:hypothetical protein
VDWSSNEFLLNPDWLALFATLSSAMDGVRTWSLLLLLLLICHAMQDFLASG